MKTIISVFLIMVLSSKGIAQYECGSFEDCLSVGIAAYQDENYEGAVGYLNNAIAKWKDTDGTKKLISAHMYRGNSNSEMKLYLEAIRDYNRILMVLDHKYAPAYRMRAAANENLGEFKKATDDYGYAIQIENQADDYSLRGIVYSKMEKFDEAINDLTKAIEMNPEWVDYYLKRAQIYFLMKKYDEALKDASTAQDLNAIIPDPYTLSTTIYLKMGKFNEALEQVNSAINFAPEEAQLYATRGLIYYKLNKSNEAIADLKKAIDMGFDEARQYIKSLYKIDY